MSERQTVAINPRADSPTRFVRDVLADGQWHDATEVIRRAGSRIPAGRAAQAYRRKVSAKYADSRPTATLVAEGRHEMIRKALASLVERQLVDIKGRQRQTATRLEWVYGIPGAVQIRLKDISHELVLLTQMAVWLARYPDTLRRAVKEGRAGDCPRVVNERGQLWVYQADLHAWATWSAQRRRWVDEPDLGYQLYWAPLGPALDALWNPGIQDWERIGQEPASDDPSRIGELITRASTTDRHHGGLPWTRATDRRNDRGSG